jgi:transcriptional regulator with XRE-family HTH domain
MKRMDADRDAAFAAMTLREARRRAQLSQQALAAAAGVPPSVLSAYETGARQPSAKMLARLVRAAGAELGLVEADARMLRQKAMLEQVVAVASQMPQRPAGDLAYPTFRSLQRG